MFNMENFTEDLYHPLTDPFGTSHKYGKQSPPLRPKIYGSICTSSFSVQTKFEKNVACWIAI